MPFEKEAQAFCTLADKLGMPKPEINVEICKRFSVVRVNIKVISPFKQILW